jgi:predicted nucleotidyltransferase
MILSCVLLFLVTIFFSNLFFENRRMKKLLKYNKMFHKALKEDALMRIKAVSYLTRGYLEFIIEHPEVIEGTDFSKVDLKEQEEIIDDLLKYIDDLELAVSTANDFHEKI